MIKRLNLFKMSSIINEFEFRFDTMDFPQYKHTKKVD